MKLVTPMELYSAARELCLRLYVINGGNPHDTWHIRPYPGTAAIARKSLYGGVSEWTLCMPAFPMNVRLPRWKADLVAAYTIHELLHSLWTDWDAVKQSRLENLHNLQNALEDCRIEARASRGDLVLVSEARRLLEALNTHIARRALQTPGFRLDAPEQFSFVLGLVIFVEKLGYRCEFPADWRARVRPEWLPLFKLALDRFDALASTADVLQLCRDLKALAASLPKPPKRPRPLVNPPPFSMPVNPGDLPGDIVAPMDREPEIVEPEDEIAPELEGNKPGMPSEGSQKPAESEDDDEATEDAPEDEDEPTGSPEASGEDGEDEDDDVSGKPGKGKSSEDDEGGEDAPEDEHEGGDEGRGSRSDEPGKPEHVEPEPEPAEDVTDSTQVYNEAHLDDLSIETQREAGVSTAQVMIDAADADIVLNAPALHEPGEPGRNGNVPKAAGAITSPAKLKRHLTLAVKSPERVAKDRHQVSGRLDMRDVVGIAIGKPNVFSRRIEDEGREAAVTLLVDVSGSMAGYRLAAAKALALHMGDALKAAGVKFEVAAFDDRALVTPKPMAKGWNNDTKRAVAGLTTGNGTCLLPAMRQCVNRLVKQGNVTRRILMPLTDGQDSYSETANRALVRWARTRGVEIVGIALMTGGMATTFDGAVVNVRDVSTLSTVGLATLVKTLDAGAPRVG